MHMEKLARRGVEIGCVKVTSFDLWIEANDEGSLRLVAKFLKPGKCRSHPPLTLMRVSSDASQVAEEGD